MTTFTTENFTTSIEVVNKPFATLNGRGSIILFEVFQINETYRKEIIDELDDFYEYRGSDWDLSYEQGRHLWESSWYVCKDIETGKWFILNKYFFDCTHNCEEITY
jgi:hypothetical protein